MHIEEKFRERADRVREKWEQLSRQKNSDPLCLELIRRLKSIENVMLDSRLVEKGGHFENELGGAPTMTNMLEFQLNRCEVLIESILDKSHPGGSHKFTRMVYLPINLALYQLCLRWLLSVKSRITKGKAAYTSCPVVHLAYVKFPFRLAFEIKRLLFKITQIKPLTRNREN